MRHAPAWLLATLLPLAACAGDPPPVAMAPAGPPPLASADQAFVMAASASDAGEVQAGKLAQAKARSPRVKALAAKMVQEHIGTTEKLTAIAQSKGVTLTPAPNDMAKDVLAKLEADKPREFDRDYIKGQVMSHEAAVQVFQTEVDTGQDADLKAYATATLPALKQHLALARRLAGRG